MNKDVEGESLSFVVNAGGSARRPHVFNYKADSGIFRIY